MAEADGVLEVEVEVSPGIQIPKRQLLEVLDWVSVAVSVADGDEAVPVGLVPSEPVAEGLSVPVSEGSELVSELVGEPGLKMEENHDERGSTEVELDETESVDVAETEADVEVELRDDELRSKSSRYSPYIQRDSWTSRRYGCKRRAGAFRSIPM